MAFNLPVSGPYLNNLAGKIREAIKYYCIDPSEEQTLSCLVLCSWAITGEVMAGKKQGWWLALYLDTDHHRKNWTMHLFSLPARIINFYLINSVFRPFLSK